jgi:hypothetical protein
VVVQKTELLESIYCGAENMRVLMPKSLKTPKEGNSHAEIADAGKYQAFGSHVSPVAVGKSEMRNHHKWPI